MDRKARCESVYSTKDVTAVGWDPRHACGGKPQQFIFCLFRRKGSHP